MDFASKKCEPCELGTKPFEKEEAEKYLREVDGWEIEETEKGLKIRRRFTFNTYKEGIGQMLKTIIQIYMLDIKRLQ